METIEAVRGSAVPWLDAVVRTDRSVAGAVGPGFPSGHAQGDVAPLGLAATAALVASRLGRAFALLPSAARSRRG